MCHISHNPCRFLTVRPSLRHYLGVLDQENLLSGLESRLAKLSPVYDFKPLEYKPNNKDGGVFVRFSYTPPDVEESQHWSVLQSALSEEAEKHGGMPSWIGMWTGNLWVVRGTPWNEVRSFLTRLFLSGLMFT